MSVVLVEPEIPWNTGNIGRTCVAAGASLHLVGKLGFTISERQIKRSGLDYWPRLKLERHESFADFEKSLPENASLLFFTGKAKQAFWEAPYEKNSYLVFGKESDGLPASILNRHQDKAYRIPMAEGERSLNLSTAAGIAIYEGLRKLK